MGPTFPYFLLTCAPTFPYLFLENVLSLLFTLKYNLRDKIQEFFLARFARWTFINYYKLSGSNFEILTKNLSLFC